MRAGTWLRLGCGLAWLAGCGCSALREIPHADYAARGERRNVRLETVDGLHYEFDVLHVEADSLIGYRRRDVEGTFDEMATVRLALDDVAHLQARGVDWYRTTLVASGALAAIVAAGLSSSPHGSNGGSSGGGKGGIP